MSLIYHLTAFKLSQGWRLRASSVALPPGEGRLPVAAATPAKLEIARLQLQAANGGEGGSWGDFTVEAESLNTAMIQHRPLTPAQARAIRSREIATPDSPPSETRPPRKGGNAKKAGARRKDSDGSHA